MDRRWTMHRKNTGTVPALMLLGCILLTNCAGGTAMERDDAAMEARIAELEAEVARLQTELKELHDRLQPFIRLREILETAGERFRGLSDRARINSARAELATFKNGLGMFQAESDDSAYPRTGSINSYVDLARVVSPYVSVDDEEDAAFTFVSYTSARPDTFVLKARARDRARTLITVTPTTIRP